MVNLKGKSALVTGSTSGIGLAMVEGFAKAGANVTLNGLGDKQEIEEKCNALKKRYGVEVSYDGANMLEPDAIRSMIEQAEKRSGGLDILVNNAGIQHVAPVETFPTEKWDAILAINLSSAFHATAAALPGMKSRNWGRIINVASVHGLRASANKVAYVAAKHGVVGMTKTVALETAQSGITCNAICPGWVLTDLVKAQIEARMEQSGRSFQEESEELLREKTPSLGFVTTEHLAELALFLCGEAGSQITGSSYQMDGGWSAR